MQQKTVAVQNQAIEYHVMQAHIRLVQLIIAVGIVSNVNVTNKNQNVCHICHSHTFWHQKNQITLLQNGISGQDGANAIVIDSFSFHSEHAKTENQAKEDA